MEKQLFVKDSNNPFLQALTDELEKAGIREGSDVYYEDEAYKCPFFKIPKKYLKEDDTDPDFHYIFVDVEEFGQTGLEYTVQGNFVHEHFNKVEDAVRLIKALLEGTVVEMALVFGDMKASFFMNHTGDHAKNVNFFGEDKEAVDYVFEACKNPSVCSGLMHSHVIFSKVHPYYLMCEHTTSYKLRGIEVYMASAIFGQHPEYYVIQQS